MRACVCVSTGLLGGGGLLVSKLFSGARWQVQPALMWGGNSSIDPGVSFSGGQWWCIVLVSPALPFC